MSNNKITTYLLYAVGEIVLVVVGILIAVQIDQFQQDRKNKELANQYLRRIQSEFRQNMEIHGRYAKYLDDRVQERKVLSDFLNGIEISDSVKLVQLNEAVESSMVAFTLHDNFTTFTELKASGNIKILGDTTIIRELMEFELRRTRIEKVVDLSINLQMEIWPDVIQNQNAKLREVNGSMKIVHVFDLASLVDDESFKNAFFTISQIVLLLKEDFDNYKESVAEVEKLITTKLEAQN